MEIKHHTSHTFYQQPTVKELREFFGADLPLDAKVDIFAHHDQRDGDTVTLTVAWTTVSVV